MKDLRWWCVVNAVWLFVVYNAERWTGPLGVAPVFYPSVLGLLLCAVWLEGFHDRRHLTLPALGAVYLSVKLLSGASLGDGAALLTTGLELFALALTAVLGSHFGRLVAEFRASAEELVLQNVRNPSARFEETQGQIFREIRRARRHDRPAALLTVTLNPADLREQPDRLQREIQRETLERYAASRVGEILHDEMNAFAIITQRDDEFIALLPETRKQDAAGLVQRLTKVVDRDLGLKLQAGWATFPDEEVTLAKLVERAERRMWMPESTPEDPAGRESADDAKLARLT